MGTGIAISHAGRAGMSITPRHQDLVITEKETPAVRANKMHRQ
jgi:hypothetical protein